MLELNSRFDILIPRSEYEKMSQHQMSMIEHMEKLIKDINTRVPTKSEVDAQLEKTMRDIK
jgi:hypothetical protein